MYITMILATNDLNKKYMSGKLFRIKQIPNIVYDEDPFILSTL